MNKSLDPIVFHLHNSSPQDKLFRVVVYWGGLPESASLHLGFAGVKNVAVAPKRKPAGNAMLKLFPAEINAGCGRRVKLDPSRIYQLMPGKDRRSDVPEILIPAQQSVVAALRLRNPKKIPRGAPPQFDIVQMEGNRVVGGVTVQVRGPLQ